MKKLLWVAGGLAALAMALIFASDGHPARMLVGVLAGPAALDYREPRHAEALQPGPPDPTLSPGEAGIDPAVLEQASVYAAARNSRALLIAKNGHLVFSQFWNGAKLDEDVDASGFSPVLAALVLGTAVQNGEVASVDLPLSTIDKSLEKDPRGAITLRQMLAGDSGFAAAEGRPWPGSLAAKYRIGDDRGAALQSWPLDPGLRAGDSPADINADILVHVLAGRLEGNFWQQLSQRVWKPLGGGSFSLAIDGEQSSAAHAHAGCCVRARVSDWLRVGSLLANQGVFEGNQLLSPDFATLMLSPSYPESPRTGGFLRRDGQFIAHDLVWLGADGRQRLWIVPSLKLAILRIGDEPSADAGWDEAMIPDTIVRGTQGWHQQTGGEGVDPKKYAPH